MRYVIIGSAIDGNKGAASMLEAAIQTLSKRDELAYFTLLSMYPEADKAMNTYGNLNILSAKPLYLGAVINLFALVYKILPPLRPILRKNKQIKAIAEADVYLDQGGITFVDGREVFLIYNIASILPPLLIGTPVVKCSQAMGPFKSPVNRFFSKLFLPRVTKIFARGEKTHNSLINIGLNNVELAADYAFSKVVTKSAEKRAKVILKNHKYDSKNINIGVFPSEVLRKKAEKRNQKYEQVIADFIDSIASETNTIVYLIPHSQKANISSRHNNDLPVCNNVYELIKNKDNCRYISEPTSPQELRYIIGQMEVNVVARFHAMVSSLAMSTPVLVTGWSHKYQEVLDMFNLKDCAFDVRELSTDQLKEKFQQVYAVRRENAARIRKHLPKVKKSSLQQADKIVEIAKE